MPALYVVLIMDLHCKFHIGPLSTSLYLCLCPMIHLKPLTHPGQTECFPFQGLSAMVLMPVALIMDPLYKFPPLSSFYPIITRREHKRWSSISAAAPQKKIWRRRFLDTMWSDMCSSHFLKDFLI